MTWIHQILVTLTKLFSHLFFRVETRWAGTEPRSAWEEDIRVITLLNHTSLFEPLYLGAFPFRFVWRTVPRTVVPGADKTLERPLVGGFLKLLIPGLTAVSRKRDETWQRFLGTIRNHSVVLITAEGRMRRRDGFDREGKPLTVRGGIADILHAFPTGKMLVLYSGGLHHVQAPGELSVRLFQRLQLTLELIDIAEYKRGLSAGNLNEFRSLVKQDLERRKTSYVVPASPEQKPPGQRQ